METSKVTYKSIGVVLHHRSHRPTLNFERAQEKASSKNSDIVWVHGNLESFLDPETQTPRMRITLPDDIIKKIQTNELFIGPNMPIYVDDDTQTKIKNKRKREVKDSTKGWRKC
jgi:hypothetical protein